MGHPMRLELTLAGLLVKLANHYTTRGAHPGTRLFAFPFALMLLRKGMNPSLLPLAMGKL